MQQREPALETISASFLRGHWRAILDQVARGERRVLVTRQGVPVAALIALDDLERLQRFENERASDVVLLTEMQAAFRDVPNDELERSGDLALEEVRAEQRQREPVATRSA